MEDITIISKPPSDRGIKGIVGFPGSGLVGSISVQYLVDNAGFNYIGSITSKYFPPITMMIEGVINAPVRIYEKDNIVAFVADIPIHPSICYEISYKIIEWLMEYDLKEIVVIAGLITNMPEKRVFGVGTETEVLDIIKDKAEILPMGSISGIPGSILTECKIRNIPAVGLLGETVNTPDPRSSVSVLSVINDLYGFDVDVNPLMEQAEEIEASMQKMAEQVRDTEDSGAPKKEHLPMYG
ncbi:proteasome assembly chaperone family protein [Methanoplanus endosymbiosus]|uniref:Proteasome assembly chaperone family protein n=1 Tax=Methanoplanus endosymbiosus TaxID=33865 RepID=A0A9E7PQ45_9EURY|nr:proteasome assembly chaperone family protein [Methanoplanus endosymbiosus]UUX92796.1 proteasome assembly chaperone family protein [Methanoplanus endosymbiosus]